MPPTVSGSAGCRAIPVRKEVELGASLERAWRKLPSTFFSPGCEVLDFGSRQQQQPERSFHEQRCSIPHICQIHSRSSISSLHTNTTTTSHPTPCSLTPISRGKPLPPPHEAAPFPRPAGLWAQPLANGAHPVFLGFQRSPTPCGFRTTKTSPSPSSVIPALAPALAPALGRRRGRNAPSDALI